MATDAKTKNISPEKPALSDEFKKEYVISIKGKEFVRYPGLVTLSKTDHFPGCPIKRIDEANVLLFPTVENNFTTIVRAVITDKDGNDWTGLGDASPRNCNKDVASHSIRVAATRAKGRVLRDLLGIDMVLFEEINPFAPPEPINDEQRTYIKKLLGLKGLSKAEAKQLMIDTTGRMNSNDMSFYEAVDFISSLERKPDKTEVQEETSAPESEIA